MNKTLATALFAATMFATATPAFAQQVVDECEQIINDESVPLPNEGGTSPGENTAGSSGTSTRPSSRTPYRKPTGPGVRDVDGNLVVVKNGKVVTKTLTSPMKSILDEVYATAQRLRLPTPVITSGRDGKHMDGSKHYTGNGIDLRCNFTYATNGQCREWTAALRSSLGRGYTVLFETYKDPANNHIHIQYNG